jgi:hypothetical protein
VEREFLILFFGVQSSPAKGISVIQTWSGRVPKQHFSYSIPQNGSYTFNWAFQKQAWSEDAGLPYSATGVQRLRLFDTDSARIDSINVTNTIEGGASVCLPCAQGADASGCIPCPPGHYTEMASTHCKPCPANSVVLDPGAVGKSACINCGPGLISTDGKTCTTDCTPNINGTRYDLRKIGRLSRLFLILNWVILNLISFNFRVANSMKYEAVCCSPLAACSIFTCLISVFAVVSRSIVPTISHFKPRANLNQLSSLFDYYFLYILLISSFHLKNR